MDIVEQMRSFESDHEPDGWPAVTMGQVSALCDEVERLRAEIDAANAQEPVDYERLLNGEWVKCSKIRYEVTSDPVRALYASPIPAQQSPAVAVPDDWNAQCTCGHRWRAVMPTENCPSCNPSPRITEQDARKIALSAWRYWMNNCDRTVDNWIEDEGLDLTNKINEAKHD